MTTNLRPLASPPDAYEAGDHILLNFGNGTQIARVEALTAKRLRVRRLQARGTERANWDALTSWVSLSDVRILGVLPIDVVRREAPECKPVAEYLDLVRAWLRKAYDNVAELEAELNTVSASGAEAGEYAVHNATRRVERARSHRDRLGEELRALAAEAIERAAAAVPGVELKPEPVGTPIAASSSKARPARVDRPGKSRLSKVESSSDEGTEVFWYLKPGWARADGVHHVSYEPSQDEWSEVLAEFDMLQPCSCEECSPRPVETPIAAEVLVEDAAIAAPVEAAPSPTKTQYAEIDFAYGWFNEELFGGELPYCLLTMNRKAKAHGYFCGDRFQTRDGLTVTDEIALNPDSMRDRDDRASLATLVHEMVHLWQHRFGEPPRKSYHDRQWALKMREVGLIPSSTGEPGGKETGSRVTHYIEEGGRFAASFAALVATGWTMPFIQTPGDAARAAKQKASKTKFCCPSCEQAAWGKPTLKIICSECDELMVAATAEIAGGEA